MDRTVEGTRARSAEGAYVLLPQPRRVGPGRIERGYQRRIEQLEHASDGARRRLHAAELELQRSRGELDVAGRVERGLQRRTDRLEERLETAAQREKRLILALGALQKENELLRGQLALGTGPAPVALPAPGGAGARERPGRRPARRRGLLARLLGRAPAG